MRKSIEEILAKIEQERKERKLSEEENFKKKLEIVEKQKNFMLESRRMLESSGFSSAAAAGAGAGGSTPARMNYRKYFNLDYSSGLTLNYFTEDYYVKFFLPYVGNLRFSTDLSLLSGGLSFGSEVTVEFNQINGFWEKRSNGTLIFESNRDLYVTSDPLIDGDDGISILTPGNTSNSLLLSTPDGNLPRGLTQMTLFGLFSEITDENSPFYVGSYFETSGDEEVVLLNEGSFGGDEETWYIFLRGPEQQAAFGPDDTQLTLTGSLTPFGTYSTLNQGSEFSGTYVITPGYVI